MADTIDFYLVEEGIKQNVHTISLQEAVGRMIWNCAHAELTYVQEIQNYQNEMPKEIGNRDILAFFQSALAGDTKRLAEVHRNIYDKLMAEDGPYQKLLKHTRQEHGPRFKEIEKEFILYNTQREVLENSVKKQNQSVDNMKTLLMELEGKLSKRSRITNGRKSERGTSKLESMNAQVSHLRENIATTSAACMEDEAKLKSLVGSKKKTLQKMFLELKELDQDRYIVIHEVISQYAKDTIPQYDLIHENTESSTNLDAVNIQEIHSRIWIQTEERARLRKAGLVAGVDMFLVPSLSAQLQNLDVHGVEEGTIKTKNRPTVPPRPSVRREQQDPPQRNQDPPQRNQDPPQRNQDPPLRNQDPPQRTKSTSSGHGSAVCSSSCGAGMKNKLVMKYPSPLVTEYSEDEIETLELPEETPRPLPNPFTVREFCVYKADTSQK